MCVVGPACRHADSCLGAYVHIQQGADADAHVLAVPLLQCPRGSTCLSLGHGDRGPAAVARAKLALHNPTLVSLLLKSGEHVTIPKLKEHSWSKSSFAAFLSGVLSIASLEARFLLPAQMRPRMNSHNMLL